MHIWETMIAHVKELISEAKRVQINLPTSQMAVMLGIFLMEKGFWCEAESFTRSALDIDEQYLAPRIALSLRTSTTSRSYCRTRTSSRRQSC